MRLKSHGLAVLFVLLAFGLTLALQAVSSRAYLHSVRPRRHVCRVARWVCGRVDRESRRSGACRNRRESIGRNAAPCILHANDDFGRCALNNDVDFAAGVGEPKQHIVAAIAGDGRSPFHGAAASGPTASVCFGAGGRVKTRP